MSQLNTLFGALTEDCRKKAGHLVKLELDGDVVFFNISDSNQKPRAKVEYDDVEGCVKITPLADSLIAKIATNRVRIEFTEETVFNPRLQARQLTNLICR